MEAQNGKVEAWSPVVAVVCITFYEEQDPDPHQSEKSEPDPHQSKKDANNMAMNFRRFVSILQYKVDTEDT